MLKYFFLLAMILGSCYGYSKVENPALEFPILGTILIIIVVILLIQDIKNT